MNDTLKKEPKKNTATLWWFRDPRYKNLGDEIARIILEKLTDIEIKRSSKKECDAIAVGSILGPALLPKFNEERNKKLYVFGCGLMEPNRFNKSDKIDIVSCRGELTRSILQSRGYDAEFLGDIGLVVDSLYTLSEEKKYDISFIPHHKYIDKYNKLNENGINIIDLRTDNLKYVLQEIKSTKIVISQSLHGLIMSDSLNIPNIWYNNDTLHKGGDFKFKDYFSTIARSSRKSINDEKLIDKENFNLLMSYSNKDFEEVNYAKSDVISWIKKFNSIFKGD